MATIEERNETFRVLIRKKGISICKTFSNIEDAKLWAKYKEELIDLINNFDPPLNEMITLRDAIDLKTKESEEKRVADIGDFKILYEFFDKFCEMPLNKITYQDLLKYFQEKMLVPIQRGGSKNNKNSGVKKLPSMHTTFRKFSYLSTVFQMMKEKGVEIENVALHVCQYLRPQLKKTIANNQNI